MNNDLYRKLTSITLMTIMFAGGMTIAIPGELPTAVAQTTSGTLSVSATEFGGVQVIEIVIDDPDRDETGEPTATAEVNEEEITMQRAATGKWYAYIADDSIGETSLVGTVDTDGNYPPATTFLTGSSIEVTALVIQVFEFDDGDSVDITADRDESVTLTYDDHSGAATVSVDRNDAPAGGQVHITISDLQLNLDPTADDAWELNADNTATYVNVAAEDVATNVAPGLPGTSGELTVSVSKDGVIEYSNGADMVRIDETGSNTGVFESQDGDISEISVSEGASDGDTFTVGYADNDQQVIVNDFSSTLALITDGAWSAGQTITVRLSSENLNLNTLVDDDMTPGSDDLPVMTFGSPITPSNIAVDLVNGKFGDSMTINENTHVITLTTTNMTANLTVTITDQLDLLKNSDLRHYVNYFSDFDTTTDAQLVGNEDGDMTIEDGISRIVVAEDADGMFNLTLTATQAMMDAADFNEAENAAIRAAVEAAEDRAADDTSPTASECSIGSNRSRR